MDEVVKFNRCRNSLEKLYDHEEASILMEGPRGNRGKKKILWWD